MDRNDLSILALLTKRFTELQAAVRALSKQQGPKGDAGKDGISIKGDAGKDGVSIKGDPGKDGKDGKSIKGDPGKDGKDGEVGPKPKHRWDGTKLQFEKPDGEWGKAVDLRGKAGSGGGVAVVEGEPFDLTALPTANSTVPSEFVVRQGDAWTRATYAQMQSWLGGGYAPSLPEGAVVIDGVPVTIEGTQVVITG